MKTPKGKYAWTATVGEKGQIVIPKQAREVFGIKPGDTLLLLGDEKRGIAIPPKSEFAVMAARVFSSDDKKDDDG
ncbi:MAG: AbrB/MazE/SpoVT family DNA-binding domain-containing protein [Clostridia bacterium]|nr:AbrB/MazE/SpoVT family DNA-binding domain-containing protein [Clostridia bacterium]